MKLARRLTLHLAAGAAAVTALSANALAQPYPTRPVRIIVGLAAGGVNDILGRLIGQRLSERLGQSFVIENRPGGSGSIATEAVVKAPPDGYTLLLVGSQNTFGATVYNKAAFDLVRDIAPVASLVRQPNVLLVNPSVPATTVPELIAYGKANPGKINMASAGNGTPSHVSGELFKIMTGTTMNHVPYRGGAPVLTDLLGGQVQVYFGAMASSIEHVRAGKLRALAVTTAARSEALPDIPAMREYIPGYEASGLFGIVDPRDTSAEIIERLNKEINAALADPKMQARLADLGGIPIPGSPGDFGKLIAEEIEKWASVIRAANIQSE